MAWGKQPKKTRNGAHPISFAYLSSVLSEDRTARLDALPVHKVAGVEGQAEAEDVAGQDGPEFPWVLRAVDVVGGDAEAYDQRHGDEDKAADGVE